MDAATENSRLNFLCLGLILAAAITQAGCGTVRNTNTPRTGTEQILLTDAFDQALGRIDFSPLQGIPVYFDTKNIEAIDKGWVISGIREAMLLRGVRLMDKPEQASVIVEGRIGAFGTEDHNFLIGIPQMTIPVTLAGMPTGSVPEIALLKKNDQYALSKLALFGYERASGGIVWTSGTSTAYANSKNLFIGGLGPIQSGSHKKKPEFMGLVLPQMTVQPVPIPILPWSEDEKPSVDAVKTSQKPPTGRMDQGPGVQSVIGGAALNQGTTLTREPVIGPKELGGQEGGTVVPIPVPLPAPGGSPFSSKLFQGFAPFDRSLLQSRSSGRASTNNDQGND
ncbi:MAG: DUF6655 family protein [Isosphaeraceae bacterium]